MFSFLAWLVVFAICWPIAVLALMLWPIIWLISIPLRLVGIAVSAVLALIESVLLLPARLLTGRRF